MDDNLGVRDQRPGGASSPPPSNACADLIPPTDRLPPAGVEQPQHEPHRDDHHRSGQQNATNLAYVAESELDDLSRGAHGFGKQRRRVEAESLENDPDDKRDDNQP